MKDEAHFDKFDRAFAALQGRGMLTDFTQDLPAGMAAQDAGARAQRRGEGAIEKMGWDELMETLKKRFEEQKERHEGGNR